MWMIRQNQRKIWKNVPNGFRNMPRYAPQRENCGQNVIEYIPLGNQKLQLRMLKKELPIYDGDIVKTAIGYEKNQDNYSEWITLFIDKINISSLEGKKV